MFATTTHVLFLLVVSWKSCLAAPLDEEGKGFVGLSLFAPPEMVPANECVASNALLSMGTCYNDVTCKNVGGVPSGNCATGGVCCVIPTVCGGLVSRNRTWFVNKDFPKQTRDFGDCIITIKKELPRVTQIRLDFEKLELDGPRNGRCIGDSLRVSSKTKGKSDEVEVAPSLCGDNSGQHVYVDMDDDSEVSVHMLLDSGSYARNNAPLRQWRILVTQLDESNRAPRKCLQYYKEKANKVHSLNYGADDDFRDDLNYDVCFSELKRSDDTCTRKFSDIEVDQYESYRSRNDLTRKSRQLWGPSPREIEGQSPSKQNLPLSISDVIGLVSKTVDEVRTTSSNSINNPIENLLVRDNLFSGEVESTPSISSNEPVRINDEELKNTVSMEESESLPELYNSPGNEMVINQISQLMLQLQNEQFGSNSLSLNGLLPSLSGSPSEEDVNILDNLNLLGTPDENNNEESFSEISIPMFMLGPTESSSELADTEINSNEISVTTDYNPTIYTTNTGFDNFVEDNEKVDTVTDNYVENMTTEKVNITETTLVDDITSDSNVVEMTTENIFEDISVIDKSTMNNLTKNDLNNDNESELLMKDTDFVTIHDSNANTNENVEIVSTTFTTKVSDNEIQTELTLLDPEEVRIEGNLVLAGLTTQSNTNTSEEDNDKNNGSEDNVTTEPQFEPELPQGDNSVTIKVQNIPDVLQNTSENSVIESTEAVEINLLDTSDDTPIMETTVEPIKSSTQPIVSNTDDTPENSFDSLKTQNQQESIEEDIVSSGTPVKEQSTSTNEQEVADNELNNSVDEILLTDASPEPINKFSNGEDESLENNKSNVMNKTMNNQNKPIDITNKPSESTITNKPSEPMDSTPQIQVPAEIVISSGTWFGDTNPDITYDVKIESNTIKTPTTVTTPNTSTSTEAITTTGTETPTTAISSTTSTSTESIETTSTVTPTSTMTSTSTEAIETTDKVKPKPTTGISSTTTEAISTTGTATPTTKISSTTSTTTLAAATPTSATSSTTSTTTEAITTTDTAKPTTTISSTTSTTTEATVTPTTASSTTSTTAEDISTDTETEIGNLAEQLNEIIEEINDTAVTEAIKTETQDDSISDNGTDDESEISDEELCGGSFLKVNNEIVCASRSRGETVTDESVDGEDDRFKNIERISVQSSKDSVRSLRFSLDYETECPTKKVEPTAKPKVKKRVSLLQYILGWYR